MIVAALALLTIVHLSGMTAAAILLRARPKRVKLGFGPKLVSPTVGGITLELALIPLGGSLTLNDPGDESDPFAHRHPLVPGTIGLSGCALLLILGLILGAGFDSFLHGFAQLLLGALQPIDVGAKLIDALVDLYRRDHLRAFAIASVKVAAYNLLPLPALNGFPLAVGLLRTVAGKRSGGWNPPVAFHVVGLILMLAFGVSWAIAIVYSSTTTGQ